MYPNWNTYDDLFKKHGSLAGVDWKWLKAIAMNESTLGSQAMVAYGIANPTDTVKSVSFDGKSWGLMQLTIRTARDVDMLASAAKLNNPDYSVHIASIYISRLKRMFPQNDYRFVEFVVKAYNEGPGNAKNEYLGKIQGYSEQYWEEFQKNLKLIEENS